jgi:hypothetical protein
VGDEQDGEPERHLQVAQQPQHLGLHHHVERRRRLVGDQQPRIAGKRERDQHALALPAGQLVRVVLCAARREPDELEQLADAVRHAPPAAALARVQLDRLVDLAADALDGVERVQRALEDDRHVGPPHRAQPARLHPKHVLAAEEDLPADLGPARKQAVSTSARS